MNLQELYLKKKKSIYILNNLKNLLYSDLSFNEFNGTLPLLPDSIELLDLSHNLLDDLPSSLPFQLRRLDLSHNEFKLIHLPSVSPRIDPQQCILYGDSDENCFLNVTNNECGSCFGAFGCSRREVFNPGCVPTTTTLATTATTTLQTTMLTSLSTSISTSTATTMPMSLSTATSLTETNTSQSTAMLSTTTTTTILSTTQTVEEIISSLSKPANAIVKKKTKK